MIYLFKAFDQIEKSHKLDFFPPKKKSIFLYACATCSDLPSNRSNMIKLTPFLDIIGKGREPVHHDAILQQDRYIQSLSPKIDPVTD